MPTAAEIWKKNFGEQSSVLSGATGRKIRPMGSQTQNKYDFGRHVQTPVVAPTGGPTPEQFRDMNRNETTLGAVASRTGQTVQQVANKPNLQYGTQTSGNISLNKDYSLKGGESIEQIRAFKSQQTLQNNLRAQEEQRKRGAEIQQQKDAQSAKDTQRNTELNKNRSSLDFGRNTQNLAPGVVDQGEKQWGVSYEPYQGDMGGDAINQAISGLDETTQEIVRQLRSQVGGNITEDQFKNVLGRYTAGNAGAAPSGDSPGGSVKGGTSGGTNGTNGTSGTSGKDGQGYTDSNGESTGPGGANSGGVFGGEISGSMGGMTGDEWFDGLLVDGQEALLRAKNVEMENFEHQERMRQRAMEREEARLSLDGMDLSEGEKDRIMSMNDAERDQYLLERDMLQAENQFQRKQAERQFERAITDREEFNMQQDTKLKRMLGMFGGGSAEAAQSLTGNMEVLHEQEKGQRVLEDLRMEYVDRMDHMGQKADFIIRDWSNKTAALDRQVANALEDRYAEVNLKIEGYIDQGVTNAINLKQAMLPHFKEYSQTTAKIKGAYRDEQITLRKEAEAQAETLRKEDKAYQDQRDIIKSESTGFLHQEGQIVMYKGEPLSIYGEGQMSPGDIELTERTGIMHENGEQMTNPDGSGDPYYTRAMLNTMSLIADRNKEKSKSGITITESISLNKKISDINTDLFNLETAHNLPPDHEYYIDDATYENRKSQLLNTRDQYTNLLAGGEKKNDGGGYGGEPLTESGPFFNPEKSTYGATVSEDGIRVNVEDGFTGGDFRWHGGKRDKSHPYQCGEFVNDILGKGVFGDSIDQKKSRITTQEPSAMSAFVMSVGNQYGHVGLVESVNSDGSINIIDNNFKQSGTVNRRTLYQNAQGKYTDGSYTIDGFTDGVSQYGQDIQSGLQDYGSQIMSGLFSSGEEQPTKPLAEKPVEQTSGGTFDQSYVDDKVSSIINKYQ